MDSVEICNIALGYLGASPIESLDDTTTEAQLCAANYDAVRDAVLQERPWTFAVARRSLTADATAPANVWGYRFPLNPLSLRVFEVYVGDELVTEWDVEGRFVLCDEAGPVVVKTVDQVANPALLSAGFVQAMAARLAATLAVPIANSRALQGDLWQLYASLVKKAGAVDGMQGRSASRRLTVSTIRRARYQ